MLHKLIFIFVSTLLMVCMLFSTYGAAFGSIVPMDIKGHWAESEINNWIDKGFIKGYLDGSFKPNDSISRAEFFALVNRSFGFTETTEISFNDVDPTNWEYAEIAKAVKAGYVVGNADGTIGSKKPISRQEVAVVVSRILKLSVTDNFGTTVLKDADIIASWSKDAVGEVFAHKIMNGYALDNTFKPENPITRAEAVVTLSHAISNHVVAFDSVFDARQVKLGDTAAGLTITRLDVDPFADNDYLAIVIFEGKIEVSGTLTVLQDAEVGASEGWGLTAFFTPDAGSINKIPILNNDPRTTFGIEDNSIGELASLKALGRDFKATVIIQNYEIWSTGKAQENKAMLVSVNQFEETRNGSKITHK